MTKEDATYQLIAERSLADSDYVRPGVLRRTQLFLARSRAELMVELGRAIIHSTYSEHADEHSGAFTYTFQGIGGLMEPSKLRIGDGWKLVCVSEYPLRQDSAIEELRDNAGLYYKLECWLCPTKTLHNSGVSGARKNVADINIVGNGDSFQLICKASSEAEGWMKSTKAMQIRHVGCIVQVTTQQRNPDGSYAVAEAVTFVPGVVVADDPNNPGGRILVPHPAQTTI